MFVRLLKYVLQLALLQCISGRLSQLPKFYGKDSAIIVDTDRPRLTPKLQNALYYNIPVYKLINPGVSGPTATTTTNAAEPALVDEYPSDLLFIARKKLGLKRMDQLPSIDELGKLLGTGNAAETIKYVRTLTSNDQGIALMKAYLESLDYESTDSFADNNNMPQEKIKEDDNATNNANIYANEDTLITTKAPKLDLTEGGFMQNVNGFMKQHNLWADSSATPRTVPYKDAPVASAQPTPRGRASDMRPVLVRLPLPYHYPIPLRPVLAQTMKPTLQPFLISSTQQHNSNPSTPSSPSHLNIPKRTLMPSDGHVAPHIQHLAKMANISPNVLHGLLQQQPKLAELAKRVSRLPLVQQHSRAIDAQLLMAVKKALSQNENLKRLLGPS